MRLRLLPIVTFILGFSFAWLTKPNCASTAAPETKMQTRALQPAADTGRPARIRDHTRTDAQLDALLKNLGAYRTSVQDDMKPDAQEYPQLLEALAQRAGMTGLDRTQERLMKILIIDWHQADPNNALEWVLGRKNDKDTSILLSKIIGQLSVKNWKEAITIAEQHGTAGGRKIPMPYEMQDMLGKLDAEELIRVIGMFSSLHSGSYGGHLEYADDFNYRAALDGLVALRKNIPQGEDPSFTPTNLLSKWTECNAESAWEWARTNENFPFNSISDVFEAMAKTSSPEKLAGMAIQLMEEPDVEPGKKYQTVWSALSALPSPGLIENFFQQVPGDRQEHLSQLLAVSFFSSGANYDTFKETLVQYMNSSERMTAFLSQAARNKVTSEERTFFSPILKRLGHSKQEIDLMLPVTPK